MKRIKIKYPVIVEGKYDKIKLESVIDANIFTTDGFGIFSSEEKKMLFRKLAENSKVLVLTDSDGGGTVIRSFLDSVLRRENIVQLYVPQKKGKEKRKTVPSKEGFLGVEGIDASVLRELFIPFSDEKQAEPDAPRKGQIKKVLLFEYGLSGDKESGKLRAEFAAEIGMPQNISANALLEAANALYSKEEFVKIIENFCRKRAKNRQ